MTTPTGMYRGTVVSVVGGELDIEVPRLIPNVVFRNVDYYGPLPAVDDIVWISFVEGNTGTLLALTDPSVGALAANSVDTVQIVDGAVTTSKILDDAVTFLKIAAGAVDGTALGTGAVTDTHVTDVSVSKLTAGTMTDVAVLLAGTAGSLSANFVTGVSGFKLDSLGATEINGLTGSTGGTLYWGAGTGQHITYSTNWEHHIGGVEYMRVSTEGITHYPTNTIDSGIVVGKVSSGGYVGLRTGGMLLAGSEYVIRSDGTNTFISGGTGGTTYLRGPADSSTAQVTVSATYAEITKGRIADSTLYFGASSTEYLSLGASYTSTVMGGAEASRLYSSGILYTGASVVSTSGMVYFGGSMGAAPNDYIWYDGSNWRFYTNGSERFRSDSSGSVWATGSVVANSAVIYFGGSMGVAPNDYIQYNVGSAYFSTVINGGERTRVTNSGLLVNNSGSASAPAYSFVGTANSGMFRGTTSTALAAGGVAAVFGTTSGALAAGANIDYPVAADVAWEPVTIDGISAFALRTATSKRALKANIQDWSLSVEAFMRLKPRSYLVKGVGVNPETGHVEGWKTPERPEGRDGPENSELPYQRAGQIWEEVAEVDLHLVTQRSLDTNAFIAALIDRVQDQERRLRCLEGDS